MSEKSPLGVIPSEIYWMKANQQRQKDLFEAMERYSKAGMVIPLQWIQELKDYWIVKQEKGGVNDPL